MIAHWMLYCAGVGALLCAGALAAERALRSFGRGTRWAWAMAIVLTLAIPAAARWLPRAPQPVAMQEVTWADADAPAALPALSSAAAEAPRTIDVAALDRPLALLWMGSSAVAVLALLAAWALLLLRRRTWRAAEVDGVPVLLSPRTGPAVVGLLRSRIVLPEWVVRDTDPDVRALLLEHEREHLRAGDPRLLALALSAVALMPWNPAAWWQLRRLRLAVEVDCDARVLARRADVRTYGRLLLEVGRRASSLDRMITAAAFSEPASFLERRIRMMTMPRARRPLLRAAGFGGTAALLVAAACRAPGPAQPAPADPPTPAPTENAGAAVAPAAPGSAQVMEAVIAPAVPGSARVEGVIVSTARGSARMEGVVSATTPGSTRVEGVIAPTARGSARMEGVVAATTPGSARVEATITPGARGSARVEGVVAPAAAPAGRDTVPAAVANPEILTRALRQEYPAQFRAAGIEGTAVVEFRVAADGSVGVMRIVESSHPAFGEAAVRALAAARFNPARSRGAAVASIVRIPLQFRLDRGATRPAGVRVGGGERTWDRPPVPASPEAIAHALRAEYPPLLRDAGVTGDAQVRVHVSATGVVMAAEAVEASHPEAAAAAVRALTGALFHPARRGGHAVEAAVVVPVRFRVDREERP